MILTITSIELKNPFLFFGFGNYARLNVKQLKASSVIKYKAKGIWTKHYTMSLWNNREDMQNYARTGHHKNSMAKSGKFAKVIRTYTLERDEFPSWPEAKSMLIEKGKALHFK